MAKKTVLQKLRKFQRTADESGRNQGDVASQLGISRQYWSDLLSGSRRPSMFVCMVVGKHSQYDGKKLWLQRCAEEWDSREYDDE